MTQTRTVVVSLRLPSGSTWGRVGAGGWLVANASAAPLCLFPEATRALSPTLLVGSPSIVAFGFRIGDVVHTYVDVIVINNVQIH